jgi:hypothetical protein
LLLSGRLLIHDQEEVGWPEKIFISVLTTPGGGEPILSKKTGNRLGQNETGQVQNRIAQRRRAEARPVVHISVSGAGLKLESRKSHLVM